MSTSTRPARAEDVLRLWPAVKAARLMTSAEELAAYRESGPWRVRVNDAGEAMLLAVWRAHLPLLAIRGLWAAAHRIGPLVDDAVAVARAQGLPGVLSPLVDRSDLHPYLAAGMEVVEPLVALQGVAEDVAGHPVRAGLAIRVGGPADLEPLAQLDAACFDDFWRYGPTELGESLAARDRLRAEKDGVPVGYATCSVHGASATLGRLAVSPEARREGVGSALLADVAGFALRSGAFAVTLCTQEANAGSRALYATMSLVELPERYALAARRT